jgi:hypothetical protein
MVEVHDEWKMSINLIFHYRYRHLKRPLPPSPRGRRNPNVEAKRRWKS